VAARKMEQKIASKKVRIDNTSHKLLNKLFLTSRCKSFGRFEVLTVMTAKRSSEV
jgi:hypothetical protein